MERKGSKENGGSFILILFAYRLPVNGKAVRTRTNVFITLNSFRPVGKGTVYPVSIVIY
jgi:hypothetical protein